MGVVSPIERVLALYRVIIIENSMGGIKVVILYRCGRPIEVLLYVLLYTIKADGELYIIYNLYL